MSDYVTRDEFAATIAALTDAFNKSIAAERRELVNVVAQLNAQLNQALAQERAARESAAAEALTRAAPQAPAVTIQIPEGLLNPAAVEVVNVVELPARTTTTTYERDTSGLVKKSTSVETDA
ncbi:MAG: hypothetical protein LCI03_20610 [Actinobacteria bacterium]|nr:hypothetical protein [Actinomycetota bacterium]